MKEGLNIYREHFDILCNVEKIVCIFLIVLLQPNKNIILYINK